MSEDEQEKPDVSIEPGGSNRNHTSGSFVRSADRVAVEPETGRTVRRRQGWALAAFAVLSAAAIVTSLIAQRVVDNQERLLAQERASALENVFRSTLLEAVASVDAMVQATSASPDQIAGFNHSGAHFMQTRGYSYLALVNVDGALPSVISSLGDGPQPGTVLDGPRRAAILTSASIPDQLVTTPIRNDGGKRHLGGIIYRPSAMPSRAIYLETPLGPAIQPTLNDSPLFTDVNVALYDGTNRSEDQIIVSSGAPQDFAKKGTVTRTIKIGASDFSLLVRPTTSLLGGISSSLPYIVLGSGFLTALLIASLIAILQRRRQYALDLVDMRTAELGTTMEALRQRAEIDALLRRASRDIAHASDIESALTSLYATAREVIDIDRLSLSTIEGDEVVIIAVVGPHKGELHAGMRFPKSTGGFKQALEAGHVSMQQDLGNLPGYELSMRSGLTIPLISAGEARALIAFGSLEPNTYAEEDLLVMEAIGRETSGAINQLLMLRQERETARRLKEVDQLKNEFVGIVAHDLRSPMTVIAGFADLLVNAGDRLTTEEKNVFLEKISTHIRRLADLVEDVLQVARIESGELKCEIEPFDLTSLVKRTAQEIAGSHEGRDCTVNVPDHAPQAMGDEQRHWQIFSNLVNNAFKFSPAHTPVEVDVQIKDNFYVVSVRDHGIGINPADADRIFQKFSRIVHDDGPKPPGTGLGLYIAKSLVEAQGGTISLESQPGEGALFRYTVPLADQVDLRQPSSSDTTDISNGDSTASH